MLLINGENISSYHNIQHKVTAYQLNMLWMLERRIMNRHIRELKEKQYYTQKVI